MSRTFLNVFSLTQQVVLILIFYLDKPGSQRFLFCPVRALNPNNISVSLKRENHLFDPIFIGNTI